MFVRSIWATCAAASLSMAACQSVHTQPAAPAPTPAPTLDQPVSMSLSPAASPSPAALQSGAPVPAAPKRLAYSSVPGAGRVIAMTFDDGPSPKLTPMLLDMLKQRGIKVTFFVVGQNAAEYPDILKRAAAEGHEIGNHSWNHPQLTHLSAAGVDSQIEQTNAAIRAAIGHNPVLIRPPYGATNAALDRRFNEQYGLKVILWEVDPLDWKYRNSARVEREILNQTKPGSIILSHDIHATTVAAMPDTLDALLAKGYKFVTVSELIAMEKSPPAKPATVAPKAGTPAPGSAAITPPPAPSATPASSDHNTPPPPASPTPSVPATEGSAAR
ncbi:MAG: polysaccharide deacetylase family protein [Terrimicrobiaceae bacterium]|nr:polysaccharide deacetylase family protein [Terrimicrobiaceae bacterium]